MELPTIADRVAWIEQVVEYYAQHKGATDEPVKDKVTDLVASLMHLCEDEDVDFASVLRTAKMHFEAEVDEECDNCAMGVNLYVVVSRIECGNQHYIVKSS